MTTYLNMKTSQGLETLDHLSSEDFPTMAAFRAEKKRLKAEYVMAFHGGDLYWSQRACNGYND